MDKYEYQVCLQEIDSLIQEQDYQGAADIADTIDWKRVKSVITLCKISDLYKINGRYEDARNILLLAYDRNPSGRQIVSSLCTLELKLDHYLYALKYYQTFIQLAPRDPERYVLQYKMYQAQNVSLIEQIEVLETLKQADYRERWGYELAYLYYQQANYSAAIRECDELAATFGDGKYVRKAKALKAAMTGAPMPAEEPVPAPAPAVSTYESGYSEEPYHEEEAYGGEQPYGEAYSEESYPYPEESYGYQPADEGYGTEEGYEGAYGYPEDSDYPAEEAAPEEEDDDTRIYKAAARPVAYPDGARPVVSGSGASAAPAAAPAAPAAEPAAPAAAPAPAAEAEKEAAEEASESAVETDFSTQALRDVVAQGLESIDGKYEGRLSQESSGQYGMVLEEQPAPEKQITGQMYLYGMAGWEKTKNEMEQRFMNETRKRISENTGSLLRDFEETSKQGYLEELEQDLDREEIEAAAESVIPDGMVLSDGMTPQARYRAALARGEAVDGYGYDDAAYEDDMYAAGEYPEEDYPAEEAAAVYEPAEEAAEPAPAAEPAEAPEEAAPAAEAAAAETPAEPEAAAETPAEESAAVTEETVDAKDDEDPEATKAWSYKEVRTLEQEAALQTAISESRRKQKEQQLREERERRQSQQRMERSELDRQKAEVERRMAEIERERAELMRVKAEQERELAKQREEILEQARKDAETVKAEAAEEKTVEPAAAAAPEAAAAAAAVTPAASVREEHEEETLDEEIRAQVEAEGRQRLEDSRPMGRVPAEAVKDAVPAAGVRIVDEPVHAAPAAEVSSEDKETDTEAKAPAAKAESAPAAASGVTPEQAEEEQRIREHEERRKRAEAARRAYTPREMTDDERGMFMAFLSDEKTASQITYALDTMSLAAYTGNIVIAGSSREASMNLAKAFIRYMRSQDVNFSGKVAHSTGEVINRKDLIKALHSIENGALIVEGAGAMSDGSIRDLCTGLDREDKGLLVILIDSVKKISQMFGRVPELEDAFNIRVDLVPMNNDALVADAVRYAEASGYSIDDFGVLALHTRIAGMQTIDHTVTVDEVRDIVDEAISYADKKTPGRLMGRMFGKRYDDNRRVILREKDFQHNN